MVPTSWRPTLVVIAAAVVAASVYFFFVRDSGPERTLTVDAPLFCPDVTQTATCVAEGRRMVQAQCASERVAVVRLSITVGTSRTPTVLSVVCDD